MFTHNQIIQGDCIEVMKSLPDNTVDLVVTDPPYLVNYKDRSGRTIKNDNSPDTVLDSFQEIYRLLKPDTFCISFYGWNTVDIFFKAWKDAGFKPVGHITWSKNYSSHIGFLKAHHEQAYLLAKGRPQQPSNPIPDVQPWEYSGNKNHPTEKAVTILKPLVKSFSKPGDLVLDPFSGSGSTSVAAKFTGRNYLGIELEQKYCDKARTRLEGAGRYMELLKAA